MNTETTCVEKQPLTDAYLEKMNAYWRAANYLSAAQLYLLDNPLLRQSAFERAFAKRTHQEKDCRTLGNRSGTEFCILPHEPCD